MKRFASFAFALSLGSIAFAQTPQEVAKARGGLSGSEVADVVRRALAAENDKLKLSSDQSTALSRDQAEFQDRVREFLKRQSSDQDVSVPDKDELIKRLLKQLSPGQANVADRALNDAARKQFSEHHKEQHTSRDGKSSSSSETSRSSDSQSSSQSSSQSNHSSDHSSKHDSSSQRDSHSDKHSDSSKDQKSDGKQDSGSQRKERGSSNREKKSWKSMNQNERRATLRSLINELPASERPRYLKELNLEQPGGSR